MLYIDEHGKRLRLMFSFLWVLFKPDTSQAWGFLRFLIIVASLYGFHTHIVVSFNQACCTFKNENKPVFILTGVILLLLLYQDYLYKDSRNQPFNLIYSQMNP